MAAWTIDEIIDRTSRIADDTKGKTKEVIGKIFDDLAVPLTNADKYDVNFLDVFQVVLDEKRFKSWYNRQEKLTNEHDVLYNYITKSNSLDFQKENYDIERIRFFREGKKIKSLKKVVVSKRIEDGVNLSRCNAQVTLPKKADVIGAKFMYLKFFKALTLEKIIIPD